MALALNDRVQQTGTANTTVSFTLTGSVTGYQSFSVIGNGNTTYYAATDASGNWEVGIGTYSTTGPTLTRTTILASSNSGSAVTFSGTVSVFVTYPSGKSVNLDGSNNVSALGTIASGTWQGSTVGVAYGGTGVTTSSGANSVMLRDANQNVSINRLNQANTSTAAAAGITTLTAASSYSQTLTGTGTQTYRMPDATTLTTGVAFVFNNNATGTLTLQDAATATIGTITAGGAVELVLLSNVTVAGTWDVHAYIPENVTWGTNSLALGSTVITGGTWNGGTIPTGYGGTGLTTFTAANNALYSTSGSALAAGTLPVAAGGTGQTTASAAFNALSPITSTGDLILGNGTNSATRLPIGASTYVLTSNGTTASWAAPSGGTTALYTRTSFTATAGQTSFTVSYTVGVAQVYQNGVLLNSTDYTASSGTVIVLAVGAAAGDIIEVVAYTTGAIATTISLSGGLANQIPYQTAPSTTGFITAPSSASTYLNWTGSAYSWESLSSPPTIGNTTPNTIAATNVTVSGSSTPTNGMYLPTTNSLGFSTNSVENCRIDANGDMWNIVNATLTSGWYRFGDGTITYGGINGVYSSSTAGYLTFNTLEASVLTEQLRITTNGGMAFGGATNYGTTGQKLISAGDANPIWTSSSSASVFTTGSAQTYTVPAGCTRLKITVVGPGGNGGGATASRATGGSGGGLAIKWLAVAPGNTLTYTVGTSSGTASSVSSGSLIITTITGNSGSNGTTTAYANSTTDGPAGGTATNGDINITGQQGGTSYGTGTTVATNYSGQGANGQWGTGGQLTYNTAAAGKNAVGYGSGGGGGLNNATGGTGGGGIIIFEPY